MFSKEHHAQFVPGKREDSLKKILSFLDTEGVAVKANPDVLIIQTETFGINESKSLKSFQSVKPFGRGSKYVVISFFSITREAQNALLKIFEEPIGKTRFLVAAPSFEILLPTLQSRFELVRTDRPSGKSNFDGQAFMASTIRKRVETIQVIFEKKDKEKAIELLDAIETAVQNSRLYKTKEFQSVVTDILSAKKELRGRSPSVKMLLEHIAYSLPVVQ